MLTNIYCKNMYPEISIVMPVYNSELYLETTLNSIINQTYKNFELICVDDGSTDNSKIILEKYSKTIQNFICIEQQNHGAGIARNMGLALAKGKYTIFFDSDDIIYPNMLEILKENIENSNADMAICTCHIFKDYNPDRKWLQKNCINFNFLPNSNVCNINDFQDHAFQTFTGTPWNKLFKTEFIRKNGYLYLDLPNSNDTYFVFMNIFSADKIIYIDKPLMSYRIHNNSLVSNKDQHPLCFLKVLERFKNEFDKKDIYKKFEISYINRIAGNLWWNLTHIQPETRIKIFQDVYRFLKDIKIFEYQKKQFFYERDYYFIQNIKKYKKFCF